MNYYSTNDRSNLVSFREAVINSLPVDNGLYFPSEIPDLKHIVDQMSELSLQEVAFEIMRYYCHGDIPENKLLEILEDTFSFDVPLKKVEERIYCLELFHGPTYAFKDVGARFLARCLSYFNESSSDEVTILVATSGDTGGAVASGFYNVPGVNVVVLYPSGKVTALQERQMTTLGGNIQAIEIKGDFDDCQALVKQAFLDTDLQQRMNLSSANSINVARWIPQSIYQFVPFMQVSKGRKVVLSVPSGNYGNLTSAMLAKKMGLPFSRFIAASNANDVIPRYLKSGDYNPKDTIATISNAMDVSKPSNYVRMLELYQSDYSSIIQEVSGFSLEDSETSETIKDCLEKNDYLMDPHSAIAYAALKEGLKEDETGVFLGTAHHCKFLPTVNNAIGSVVDVPDFALNLFEKEKHARQMDNSFEAFKELLIS